MTPFPVCFWHLYDFLSVGCHIFSLFLLLLRVDLVSCVKLFYFYFCNCHFVALVVFVQKREVFFFFFAVFEIKSNLM